MKKRTIVLSVLCAAAVLTSLQAWAADEPDKRRRPDRSKVRPVVKRCDKDGDGKLSDDEKAAAEAARQARHAEIRAKLLELFDADDDGRLNKEERKAAQDTRMELRWESLPDEVKERLTRRFDKDDDGKLSDKERKAAMTARRNRKQQRQKEGRGRPRSGRRGGAGEGRKGGGRQGEGRSGRKAPATSS